MNLRTEMIHGPFIVAEIGANHGGSIDTAIRLIDAAKDAGANAVKFQTYTPSQMAAPDTRLETGPWAGRMLLDLYTEAHTPREWHPLLYAQTRSRGLVPFSSVFHQDDVDFLETLGCELYKISSFEILDLPLIRHAARTRKPMIISTGMATIGEICLAVNAAHEAGCSDLTLLKCTSAYPADCSEANLGAMREIKRLTGIHKIGLSDHTPGSVVAVAATALGATMIEKHLILERSAGGPDAAFSLEPIEFAKMTYDCQRAAMAVAGSDLGTTPGEHPQLLLRRQPGQLRGGGKPRRPAEPIQEQG